MVKVEVTGYDEALSDSDLQVMLGECGTFQDLKRGKQRSILVFGDLKQADYFCGKIWDLGTTLSACVLYESKSCPRRFDTSIHLLLLLNPYKFTQPCTLTIAPPCAGSSDEDEMYDLFFHGSKKNVARPSTSSAVPSAGNVIGSYDRNWPTDNC